MNVSSRPSFALSSEKVALLKRLLKKEKEPLATIPRVPRREGVTDFPLSFGQQRFWFLEQLEPGSGTYLIADALRLRGPLNVHALERSFDEIIRRHEVLRTTFVNSDGQPVQRVHPLQPFHLSLCDLRSWPEYEREQEMLRLVIQQGQQPIDISQGSLLRIGLWRLGEQEHVLLLALHHSIVDGWSMGVLRGELSTLYQAYCAQKPSPLPPLAIQYADYALWQRSSLQAEVLASQLTYWKEHLAGAPMVLELPTDRPRPALQSWRGGELAVELAHYQLEGLRRLCRQEGATLYMALLASFLLLLARWSGQEEMLVGTPISNRNRAEIEPLIGFFTNTLVLRGDLSGNPPFRELLRRVREEALSAYSHQDVPFEQVVEALQPQRDLSRSPLFQVMFSLQNSSGTGLELPGLRIEPIAVQSKTTKFDVTLLLEESPAGLRGTLEYNSDLFEQASMQDLLQSYLLLLDQVVTHPEHPLSTFALLTPAQRECMLEQWNATQVAYPAALPVHRLFEAQVRRTPEALALRFEQESLTYAALNQRANQVAHALHALGVGAETLVGVCLPRSIEQVVAVLAILKAGGAYLPLDLSWPDERYGFVLSDAHVPILFTSREQRHRFTGQPWQGQLLCLDESLPCVQSLPQHNPEQVPYPDQLAYLIYTSGSTGMPKGVMVTHRGLTNYLQWALEHYQVSQQQGSLVHTSLSFDLSVTSLFLPLLAGGIVTLLPEESPLEILGEAVQQASVGSLVKITPAHLAIVNAQLTDKRLASTGGVVVIGGEQLYREQLQAWQAQAPQTQFFNEYGPTETVVGCCVHPILAAEQESGPLPIGRPIANTQLYVLDPWLQPVLRGAVGELYIAGVGLARGYLQRASLTAERFVPNPFSGQPGERLYRTGDLVRYRADGTLEYVGRNDTQVKLRGYRIELGEIKSVLRQHPHIQDAEVLLRDAPGGDKRLVAYVVAKERSAAITSDVQSFLETKLPPYMQPSAFVILEALPITTNGKLDWRALAALPLAATEQQGQRPRTPVEEIIAGIWSQVLGQEHIDIDANFFTLGGHSLLIMQVASRLSQNLGTVLPLRRFFEQPTIRGLAQTIEEQLHSVGQLSLIPLEPALRDEPLPLSFGQQRLWFLDQLEPGNVSYTIPGALRLCGKLNLHALERSFNEIVRRHEILRTGIELMEGVPYQRISPPTSIILPVQDLSQSKVIEQDLLEILTQEMQKPFDLKQDSLLRVKIWRLSSEEHVLFTNQHHIISDGWSAGIMSRELSSLYQAYCAQEPSPLPPLAIQYADYALWQRNALQAEVLASQLTYWKEHLAGAPMVLELPTDRPRPALQSWRGAELAVEFAPYQLEGLRGLCRQEGATLYMALLASFLLLLGRWSGEEEMLIGTPISNRNRAEIEPLIGFFMNTLVLRGDLSGNPPFRELLRRVREEALSAYSHQDVPFEQVVEALQPQRDLSRSPLFQVMFSLQNRSGAEVELAGVQVEPIRMPSKTTKFEVTLLLEESPAGLRGTLEYNSDLFEQASMQDLLQSYLLLLDQVVVHPEQPLSTFALLTPAQRERMLEQWNATQAEYPAALPVHHLFEAQVRRTPEALALRFEEQESLTYAALNQRANQVAHALHAQGVGAETLVGVCLPRCIEQVVAVLAILKAGGAYLPLDLSWPDERYGFVLADAHVPILLTSREQRHRFAGLPWLGQLLCLEEHLSCWRLLPEQTPLGVPHPDQLAYLIYTSGSTGMPKGVMVTHRGLTNYLHWALECYQGRQQQGSLVHTSLSFDLSVTSLFLPLLAGGIVTLLPEESPLEILGEAVQQASVGSLVKITPAHLAIVNAHLADKQLASSSGVVVIGGEQLYREQLQVWQAQAPQTQFFNEYGPTETVVGCCVHPILAAEQESGSVPIGRPIANTQLYVLDRWLQPVLRGAVGELYIAGVGLARGYLQRASLTAERFVPNPFSGQPGERLYRTGDLVRYRADGTLEYVGRNDRQVKLRGYRIELGEIESVLRQHPECGDAAVLLRDVQGGEKRLVAYIALKKEEELERSIQEIRSLVQKHLPPYMVPSAFIPLNALPLTSNGKVDIQALYAYELQADEPPAGKDAPRDRVEFQLAQIWKELIPGATGRITDDFFESGGHSLLAVRLMARIQEEFGAHLPLSVLFQGATIKHLASLLRQKRPEGAISSLVPIQRAQSERPFFCVHPIGGDVLCYLELARAMGQEQAFWGLQAVGLYGGHDPYQSIEAMANHYIQALRVQQPNGPYALGGWSMGGVIAFEMARRLCEEGQEVARLVLLDSRVPTFSHYERKTPREEMIEFIEDIADLLGILEELSSLQLERLSPDEQLERFLELVHQLHLLPEDTGLASLQHRQRVYQANKQALYDYRPQKYPGHLHLIRASEGVIEVEHDITAGWGELAQGGIDCQILPGNHCTMVEKPAVQVLAAHLRTYLR